MRQDQEGGVPYHKINSLYMRDERGKMRFGEWSTPELEYLAGNVWEWDEKVDGTNIRLIRKLGCWTFRGRSDNAQLPPHLLEALQALPLSSEGDDLTIYGEGYGPKIQKGGGLYRDTPGFIAFDVNVGGWWLRRADAQALVHSLGLDMVHRVGVGTLAEAEEFVKAKPCSIVAGSMATTDCKPRIAPMEGVVCRPCARLHRADGKRIITKIKVRDYE